MELKQWSENLKQKWSLGSEESSLKLKLQIIVALALVVGLLSGYTALSRYQAASSGQQEQRLVRISSMEADYEDYEDYDEELKEEPAAPPPVLDIEEARKEKSALEMLPRHILFTFVHYRATNAFITGDFTGWIPMQMRKEKVGVWRSSVKIKPGSYKYNFLAGGKKYRDRYNTRRSGEASLLIVEPLIK